VTAHRIGEKTELFTGAALDRRSRFVEGSVLAATS